MSKKKEEPRDLLVVPIGGDDEWPEVPLREGELMVKIQVSLTSPRRVLIYDRARRYQYEGPLEGELRRIAGDCPKFYAVARIDEDQKTLVLLGPACDHEWDGPVWRSEDGRSESATCSKCGAIQMYDDVRRLP